MRPLLATATIMAFVVGACAQQADSVVERTALRQADSSYTAGMLALDVPGLVALYAADAVMYPPGEPTRTGLDAIREYAKAFASTPGLRMSAELQTLMVSRSGDLGYTINLVNATYTDPRGKPVSERLRDVHFWRKEAGGKWQLVVDVWNSTPSTVAALR